MIVRFLPPQLQKKAREELNEKPKSVEKDIQFIKEWLEKQPHLKAKTDKQWIITFLRANKFNLERTKERFDMFYTMRTLVPEFFKNRDPLEAQVQEILSMGLFLPLPKLTQDGERIILIDSGGYEPSKVIDIFKVFTMIIDILVNEDDNLIIAGLQVISDLRKTRTSNNVYLDPVVISKFLKCCQEAFPLRPKGLIFINTPSFFEVVQPLFNSSLSEALKRRMSVFLDETITLESITKAALPKDYGGENGTMKELIHYWKQKVENYREWFKEDENFYSIESKRPGKPKTSDIVFGVNAN